jgi:hypothetical protein
MGVVTKINGKNVLLELYIDPEGDAVVSVTEVEGESVDSGVLLAFKDDGIAMQYGVSGSVPFPKNAAGEVVTY